MPTPRLLRISLENTPTHVQVRHVSMFAEDLSRVIGPNLRVEVFPEARLFRDRGVLNAVHSGKIEMAVPGTWNVEPFLKDVGVFLLPFLYCRSAQENHTLADGSIGRLINHALEQTFEIKVPGLWMDLGHAQVFTLERPLHRLEHFRGLRIRVAGGRANELRLSLLGANSFTIPWPELIERLRGRTMDGIVTTYETIRSGELWNHGIRFAFEDNQVFSMYVPLVYRRFWEQLTPEERSLFQQTWNEHARLQRVEASQAQQEAREIFLKNGGRIVVPDKRELERIRQVLRKSQHIIVDRLSIDPSLVRQAEKELEL